MHRLYTIHEQPLQGIQLSKWWQYTNIWKAAGCLLDRIFLGGCCNSAAECLEFCRSICSLDSFQNKFQINNSEQRLSVLPPCEPSQCFAALSVSHPWTLYSATHVATPSTLIATCLPLETVTCNLVFEKPHSLFSLVSFAFSFPLFLLPNHCHINTGVE